MERTVSKAAPDEIATSDLRAFVRVVDLGSMTAAARSLGETKGSISRRVARLERTLGLPLVQRTGRRVVPTEDGLLYRDKAGQALDLLDDALSTVRDLHGTPTGHLRVTAPLGLGAVFLGPMIGPFLEANPGVTVELLITDAVLSFGQDRIDAALRLSAGLPDSSLVAQKLFNLAGRLVASPAYIERHGAPQHPDDLDRHRMLVPPVRGPTVSVHFEHAGGASPTLERVVRGHVLSHDIFLLREAAISGAGVALLPFELSESAVRAGTLVEVMPDWRMAGPVSLYLLTPGGPVAPKVRAFRDFVNTFRAPCPDGYRHRRMSS